VLFKCSIMVLLKKVDKVGKIPSDSS